MTVAAHEHFHQLCDATFTAHDCPPWIYESLAQFAALKIMQGESLTSRGSARCEKSASSNPLDLLRKD